ncbi:hypothetical protein [Streptomyces monomycini]|uniref:hypothetical protein n=1 Tax=Streptomyces monomycini TaxID=371720 RepID=UPI00067AA961|nr:hypothetical protein [Streptomyces monomycini]
MSTYDERGTGPVETPGERAASEGMPPPERGAAAYEGDRSAQQPTAPPPTTTSGATESVPGVYAGLPGTETDYPAGTPGGPGTPGTPASSAPGSSTQGSSTHGESFGRGAGAPEPLLPSDAREKLRQRLDHAVNGFVDRPREAVQEADGIYEELAALLPEALAARRRSLHSSWEQGNTDTEQLRVALRHYRETAQRLLDF